MLQSMGSFCSLILELTRSKPNKQYCDAYWLMLRCNDHNMHINFKTSALLLGCVLILVTILFAEINEIVNNFRATELVSHWFLCQGWEPTSNETNLLTWMFRRAMIVSLSYSQMSFFIQLVQTWRNAHLFKKKIIKLSEGLQIVKGIVNRQTCTHTFVLNKPHFS